MENIRLDQARRRGKAARRGQAIVEFTLVFIALMALIFAAFDFSFAIFVKATLHHAVREGVRYAISGQTMQDFGHDSSIKSVVKQNALALLNSEENQDKIKIRYYTSTGFGETGENAANSIIVISVEEYEIPAVAPILRTSDKFTITVSALDKMEPFPGAAPPREDPP